MKLFILNLKTTYFRLYEWLRVALLYYRKPSFLWIDLLLASQYLFRSTFRISKGFLKSRGAANIYGYGETPLTTLDKIARECRILSHDSVFELGCGSGRTVFWLSTFIRCRAVGIDYLPQFIQRAKRIQRWTKSGEVEFRNEDFLQASLKKATVIYLYGTCLEDDIIRELAERFSQLPKHVKIITVSYPLSEFSDDFKTTKHFSARFPWGRAEVFLNAYRA